jgi:hypothetical protein
MMIVTKLKNKTLLTKFKQIWQYRQFIWDVGSQNNLLTTSASVGKGCRSLEHSLD